jgi:pimeloyl-ACP methyl ester carboxylesterase
MEPAPKAVELAAGTLEYVDQGRGRPLVLLHGLATDARVWRKVLPTLATHCRCIAPTLPLGAHRLPMRRHADLSPRGQAWMVAELLDVLGVGDAVVIGSDTGGLIAQILVTERPERVGSLVLLPCEAFENVVQGPVRLFKALAYVPGAARVSAQLLRAPALRRSAAGYGPLAKHGIPDDVTAAWAGALRRDAGVRRDLARFLRSLSPRDLVDVGPRLGAFDRPTLVAWAPEDPLFELRDGWRLAGAFPQGRLELIEDSYAYISEDQPDALSALVRTFVAGPASSSGWPEAVPPPDDREATPRSQPSSA